MKIRNLSFVSLAFASLLFAQITSAQDTVHTVFGDRRPNTAEDLQKAIVKFPYTWEIAGSKSTITFDVTGTGKQDSTTFVWLPKGPQEIELMVSGNPKRVLLKFGMNYTDFTGMDFDGVRAVRGSIVVPKPPSTKPVNTPALAAATPGPTGTPGAAANTASAPSGSAPAATPASTNPFFDRPSGTTSTTDGLEKAIVNSTYTWEPEGDSAKTVTFQAGGVGQNTFFKIAWRIKGPHDVEVSIPGEKQLGKIILKFNSDFTKYSATDFDGESALKGHKVK